MTMRLTAVRLAALVLLAFACTEERITPPDVAGESFRLRSRRITEGPPGASDPDISDPLLAPRAERPLVVIPYEQLWHKPSALQTRDYLQDSAGVPLYEWNNTITYHPVVIEWKAITFLNNYDDFGHDTSALGLAERMAERLVLEATEVDGALYLPYRFDFNMHGIEGADLDAPWYSGLAQGLALSLFVRLHRATGEQHYLDDAGRFFETLLRSTRTKPNIARIDAEGYYWIEEYPMEPASQVLNGFLHALLGIHEYWQATGDERAAALFQAGVATIEKHVYEWRRPGDYGYYCLRYKQPILAYHRLHIWLLRDVSRATGGNPVLLDAANVLQQDAY